MNTVQVEGEIHSVAWRSEERLSFILNFGDHDAFIACEIPRAPLEVAKMLKRLPDGSSVRVLAALRGDDLGHLWLSVQNVRATEKSPQGCQEVSR